MGPFGIEGKCAGREGEKWRIIIPPLVRPSCLLVSVIGSQPLVLYLPTSGCYLRPMSLTPRRRKRDPLNMLILAVVIGMAVTLFYQVQVYYGADRIPFARQAPVDRVIGG